MEGGIPSPVLSCVPGVLVEFLSLPVSVISMGKSMSGAKKLFFATGHGFW
jgi:hypothetical protein